MFGRYGAIFILIAVLVCTGMLSAADAFELNISGVSLAGSVIMLASVLAVVFSKRIAAAASPEKRKKVILILKLAAVFLCGIGAIVVFCG